MQLYGLNGLPETIAALKVQAAGYRAQALKIASELPKKRNLVKLLEFQIRTGNTDDPDTARRWADKVIIKINIIQAQALMLENKASVIEGSIISLQLQAQQQDQAAARIVAQAKAAEIAAQQAKAVPAPVVSPVPPQVRVTAPITSNVPVPETLTLPEQAKTASPVSAQIPEAPLPVTLPSISKIQPVTIIPTVPGPPGAPGRTGAPGVPGTPAPSTDMKKLLPWILAAGAAFLF